MMTIVLLLRNVLTLQMAATRKPRFSFTDDFAFDDPDALAEVREMAAAADSYAGRRILSFTEDPTDIGYMVFQIAGFLSGSLLGTQHDDDDGFCHVSFADLVEIARIVEPILPHLAKVQLNTCKLRTDVSFDLWQKYPDYFPSICNCTSGGRGGKYVGGLFREILKDSKTSDYKSELKCSVSS